MTSRAPPRRYTSARRRCRLYQPKPFTTETVYATTDLRVDQARPAIPAAWIRGYWAIQNKIH